MSVDAATRESGYWDDTETWAPERLRQFQSRRLRRLILRAHRERPFYRRRFDAAGFDPASFKGPEDLRRIPTFTKEDLLQRLERHQAFPVGMEPAAPRQADTSPIAMTSGTIGEMFLATSRDWIRERGKEQVRVLWWTGWRPGARVLVPAPAWHALSYQLGWALTRLGADAIVPWGTFLPTFAEDYVETLVRHHPEFVYVFLPMLYGVIAECRRRGVAARRVFKGVRHVLVVGEAMVPSIRARVREELGVEDIFEGLGNPEGLTAHECSVHHGHHLFVHNSYVEMLSLDGDKPVGPGERGRLVLTSLIDGGASSYIRFDTGDIGAFLPGDCPCGRTWPLVEVYGRLRDMVMVGGTKILHYDVRRAVEEIPELVGVPFALLKGGEDSVLRLVVERPDAHDLQALGATLRSTLTRALGCPAEVKFSDRLPVRWKGVKVVEKNELWEKLP